MFGGKHQKIKIGNNHIHIKHNSINWGIIRNKIDD
jgi:hypothetical protein